MRKKKRIGLLILALIVPLLFWGANKEASDQSLESFSVAIEAPTSQQNLQVNYFDLLLDQGAEATVQLIVTNNGDEPIQLDLSFHRAITNALGVVEYSGVNQDRSTDLPHNIEDYVTLSDTEIQLQPKEAKQISAVITMPDEEIQGKLAGGIYIEEVKAAESNQSIQHVFSREIALLIADNPAPVTPNLVVGDAAMTQMNRRNGVGLVLENPEGAFLNRLAIKYEIRRDGETITSGEQNSLQVAPQSTFEYYIPMSETALEPGDYELHFEGNTEDNHWREVRHFTVARQAANELNETNVATKESSSNFPIYLVVIVVILVLVVFVVGYKYYQLKRKLKH